MVRLMKTTLNLTTESSDLERVRTSDAFLRILERFDGIELMCFDEDKEHVIPRDKVVGIHMCYFPYWIDMWKYDHDALIREFGTDEEINKYYFGNDRNGILSRFRKDIAFAKYYEAEYLVFHVSNATIRESFSEEYLHEDSEIIDATCEVLNSLEEDLKGYGGWLLVENLWQPGFRFTDPGLTKRLLDGIEYTKKGIMLDTGHLMHNDLSLKDEHDGIEYVLNMLDLHGELCRYIKGMHFHWSVTGEYRNQAKKAFELKEDYYDRTWQMMQHAYKVDPHHPYTDSYARKIIERVNPMYLTFEFLSMNDEELKAKVDTQYKTVFGK